MGKGTRALGQVQSPPRRRGGCLFGSVGKPGGQQREGSHRTRNSDSHCRADWKFELCLCCCSCFACLLPAQLLVTHWDQSLSSTLTAAFPFTPLARRSNSLLPVLKVEFAVHAAESEPTLQRWISGTRGRGNNNSDSNNSSAQPSAAASASASASAAASLPPAVERVVYSSSECASLLRLLEARSAVWPQSVRAGAVDPQMKRSCLIRLTARGS